MPSRGYLNDLLCLPLFVPIISYIQPLLGLRNNDVPPKLLEVLQNWLVFSIIFEVILPRFPNMFRTTADPWDVLAYLGGGLAALLFWRRGKILCTLRL